MIYLRLLRVQLHEKATRGELTASRTREGEPFFFCCTLEDRYRPPPEAKVPRETCIPIGTYRVTVDHSPRFGVDMPHVLDVPGFQGIRIHPGNKAADTEGCILVGLDKDDESPEPRILKSQLAYKALFSILEAAVKRQEPIVLDVELAVTPSKGVSP